MNTPDNLPEPDASESKIKPVIAIMGEFSVGKSTLSNLLIGSSPLPVKVTATQLPPIWIAYGDAAPYREDLEGNVIPVDIDHLDEVPLTETAVIRIFMKSDILELCDLIDMPGISDPNMASEVWENMIHHADGVLWCTHATQAWRQSEAAVWKSLNPDLYAKSLLLITRIDKILSDTDRKKVVRRVARETQGLFAEAFPISLTRALEAGDQRGPFIDSGAAAFIDRLIGLTKELTVHTGDDMGHRFTKAETMDETMLTPPTRPLRVIAERSTERPPRLPRSEMNINGVVKASGDRAF